MIVTLVLLQALTASAISPPVMLTPETTQVSPTAAARALSAEQIGQAPATPVSVTLQCIVGPDGRLGDCIPANDGGTDNIATYRERLLSVAGQARAEPILNAALARTAFYRVRPSPGSGKRVATVLVREIVSSADKAPSDKPIGTIAKGGLEINPDPLLPSGWFYPSAALRAGAQTRVSATCRVLGDLSLFCHDPKVDLPPVAGDLPMWRMPEFDQSFDQATLRAYAAMRAKPRTATGEDSVGREVSVATNWRLP